MKNNILVVGVIVVLFGALAFFGGMKYQESRRGSVARQFGGGQMNRNGLTAGRHDLKTGQSIAVFGSENTDGTVTAQSVQVNPELRMGGLRGASPSAAPTP